jgi:hypothetical protein
MDVDGLERRQSVTPGSIGHALVHGSRFWMLMVLVNAEASGGNRWIPS